MKPFEKQGAPTGSAAEEQDLKFPCSTCHNRFQERLQPFSKGGFPTEDKKGVGLQPHVQIQMHWSS